MGLVQRVNLAVSEFFGPTLQGEGPFAGQPRHFLRLGGCNLACVWCDTPYTWDAKRFDLRKEITSYDVDIVAEWLDGVTHLVITGGEPMLQQSQIIELLQSWPGWHVEIETNGSVMPVEWLLQSAYFNVSPKLRTAGNVKLPWSVDVLREFQRSRRSTFKFVVTCPDDIIEVEAIAASARLLPRQVWLMPEGTDARQITSKLGWICDAAIERGWQVTPRLHVLAWGDERGR